MSNKTKIALSTTRLYLPEDADTVAILHQFNKIIKAECKGALSAGFETDSMNPRVIHATVVLENGGERELIFGVTRDSRGVKLFEHLQRAVLIFGGWMPYRMVYPKLRNEEHAFVERWLLENADAVVMEGANGRLLTLKSRNEKMYGIAQAKLIQKGGWEALQILPRLKGNEEDRGWINLLISENPNNAPAEEVADAEEQKTEG